MRLRIKYVVVSMGLAVVGLLAATSPASAQHHGPPDPGPPTPITFSGTITDHGKPVKGLNVVAWCGGLDFFGGYDNTDENGWFEIHTTNGYNCPLNANGFLEIFHPDSSVGFAFAYMTVHTQTTVNVKLEDHNRASVPEFGWAGGVTSLIASGGVIALGRRHFSLRPSGTHDKT